MKSSSISLLHEQDDSHRYLINLIDSPGHIDFSSEVSNAVRVSDGALVLIDALEGVQVQYSGCTRIIQTHTVLLQAWREKLRCVLVINKIDRLITELKMTSIEIYVHLTRIIEKANAITSSFLMSDAMAKAAAPVLGGTASIPTNNNNTASTATVVDLSEDVEVDLNPDATKYQVDIDESAGIVFAPERGNVIFASAFDGWGFTVTEFSRFYAKRLGMREDVLRTCLWGDHFYQSKTRQVRRRPPTGTSNSFPMFVQFILEPMCAIYNEFLVDQNVAKMNKIIERLELKIPTRDLAYKDWRVRMQAVMAHWMPLHQTVLDTVVQHLPSPIEAQPYRLPSLWAGAIESIRSSVEVIRQPESTNGTADSITDLDRVQPGTSGGMVSLSLIEADGHCELLRRAALSCDSRSETPVLAFVAKMFSIPRRLTRKKTSNLIVRKSYIRGLNYSATSLTSAAHSSSSSNKPSDLSIANTQAAPIPGSPDVAPAAVASTTTSTADESKYSDAADGDAHNPEDENEEVFIAFARIFSGRLTTNTRLHIFAPKYDPRGHVLNDGKPSDPELVMPSDESGLVNDDAFSSVQPQRSSHRVNPAMRHVCTVEPGEFQLYMMMGREVEPIDSISAGNVFGIGGLGKFVLSTCTISTLPKVIPMNQMSYGSSPIVRVAVEPTNILKLRDLVHGLRLLQQSDANVEVLVQETGEHVIVASGELHLEKCLRDLHDRFARGVELKVSPPIVPFRESLAPLDLKQEPIVIATANKLISFTIRAFPLPQSITALLVRDSDILQRLRALDECDADTRMVLKECLNGLNAELIACGGQWRDLNLDSIWSFGPRWHGPNMMILDADCEFGRFVTAAPSLQLRKFDEPSLTTERARLEIIFRSVENSIVSGFQMAMAAGPLCEEPLMGVAIRVENIHITEFEQGRLAHDPFGPLNGQVMSTVKEGCRKAYAQASPRIMEPIYKVELQSSAEVLGRLYSVVSRRRGLILDEQLREGTNIFSIVASLPVVESFGFAEELRKKTSGVASPQLIFSHWQLLSQDPYFVPTTEEELATYGSVDLSPNLVRTLIDRVRRRKGLFVEEKLVASATKQRTLSKKA